MLGGANMNLHLHLKWLFRMLLNCCLTTSRAERYSAKMKVLHSQYWRTSDFTTNTMTSTRVFIIFWTLQTNFCDSARFGWLLGP